MPLTKDSDIKELKGVGERQKELFSKLNIDTVEDLLYHIPFRYQDTSSLMSIKDFKENGSGTFLGQIKEVKNTYFRKTITVVVVEDDTDKIRLTYFNQPYLKKSLTIGDLYIFNAKIAIKGKQKNIYNPSFEKFKEDPSNQLHLGKLIGVYPETKNLSSRTIRRYIKSLEENLDEILSDPLYPSYIENLLPIQEAIRNIHFPRNQSDIKKAQKRLAMDEMLRVGIKIENDKSGGEEEKGKGMNINTNIVNKFIKNLPYKLTNDQSKALEEILEDMKKDIPMNRLLNGDVGSGKTVVAATAILNTIVNGHSCILLAPTTVLAQQHYETFKKLLPEIDIELCISSKKIIKDSDNKLIIGTHAILYQKSLPKDLNLVVIDEQHRFGVEQRSYFKNRGKIFPHYLTMTATPIPRSLTEIFFGGLSVSEIREKPKGRRDIKTYYTPFEKRKDCFKWIKDNIEKSNFQNQAFFIYPLIEESEKISAKSVLVEYESLRKQFKELKVEFLHGRLKNKEKENLLKDFRDKKINILISTTVIEVGIDIPDATIMVIEDAERFGLAQLHQLRGRIGRSNKESFCFVIPSDNVVKNSEAEKRLRYFSSHNSGFEVAEYDLENRGPGEVYGTRQSGIPSFKVASIKDINLLKKARNIAKKILKEDNSVEYILDNLFK